LDALSDENGVYLCSLTVTKLARIQTLLAEATKEFSYAAKLMGSRGPEPAIARRRQAAVSRQRNSARGQDPREGPYTMSQLLAMLCRALGIDPAITLAVLPRGRGDIGALTQLVQKLERVFVAPNRRLRRSPSAEGHDSKTPKRPARTLRGS
jgi:hypothetical protein